MSIYVTGDVHCPIDVNKLNTKNFTEQEDLTRDDFVIVCGDMGIVWACNKEDAYWQKWFEDRKFTTLFIDGNHENHKALNKYPVENWKGGKVHFIKPHVIHLMRGQVFNIDNLKLFTMGGADSIDKEYRIKDLNWWEEEMPSMEEYSEAIMSLESNNFDVDVILTHCAPTNVQKQLLSSSTNDYLTNFLYHVVYKDVNFKKWYFGHYHRDKEIDERFTCLYRDIIKIS